MKFFLRLSLLLILAFVVLFQFSLLKNTFKIFTELKQFGLKRNKPYLYVSVPDQSLYLMENFHILKKYPVSTAKAGIGNLKNSFKTPLGKHIIHSKHGKNAKYGELFKGKKNIGVTTQVYLDSTDIDIDFVTTRILVLKGLEPGKNHGGKVDSYERNIFIHGTPEEGLIGKPVSKGCIRMKNKDIIELFKIVDSGTILEITDKTLKTNFIL